MKLPEPFRAAWLLFAVATILLNFSPHAAASSCTAEIRRTNIIGNALFTTLFRSANGELQGWSDLGESLGFGAAAGYLFYQSRETIGKGDESRGLAMAYLASSVTENTTHGEHPLAHLRYGLGPLEARWSTPLATDRRRALSFSVNSIDAIGALAAAASGKADNFTLRNGVLHADDRGLTEDNHSATALGRTIITRKEDQSDEGLWHHELIHTTQYLQFSSFGSERFGLFDFGEAPGGATRRKAFSVRVEWFNALVSALDDRRPYDDRWMEIEALQLAQADVSSHPDTRSCSAQLGFQFRF